MKRRLLALVLLSSIPILYLALKYLIRKRAIRYRKEMTINTNILFWNPSRDPQNPTIAFKESAIQFIRILLKNNWTLYLISVVCSDEQQSSILELLADSNLSMNGLDQRRILFCEKVGGISPITRHIKPDYHMDGNIEVVKELAPFIPNCVLVTQKVCNDRIKKNSSLPPNGILARRDSSRALIPKEVIGKSIQAKGDVSLSLEGYTNVIRDLARIEILGDTLYRRHFGTPERAELQFQRAAMVPDSPSIQPSVISSIFGIVEKVVVQACPRCSRTRHKIEQCHAMKDKNGIELPPNPLFIQPISKKEQLLKRKQDTPEERVRKRQAKMELQMTENRQTIPCKLWGDGKCVLGTKCTFKHEVGKGHDPRSRQLCTYFRSGSCIRGNECIYSHIKIDFPCAFYMKGNCRSGVECEFSHLPMTDEQKKIYDYEQEKFKSLKGLSK